MPRQSASNRKKSVKDKQGAGEVDHFPALSSSFEAVRNLISSRYPELKNVTFNVVCPHLKMTHIHKPTSRQQKEGHEWRNFMHVGHTPGEVCVHPHAEFETTMGHQYGLFLHEFGHLIAHVEGIPSTEKNADDLIFENFNIDIDYTPLSKDEDLEGVGLQYVEIG